MTHTALSVENIDTLKTAGLSESERLVLIRAIECCFTTAFLRSSPLFLSLTSGFPHYTGYFNYIDYDMIDLVNRCPIRSRREKLQRLLHLLDSGCYVGLPPSETSLLEIVPWLEEGSLSIEQLEEKTDERMDLVDGYVYKLSQSSLELHPRLRYLKNFTRLYKIIHTINDQHNTLVAITRVVFGEDHEKITEIGISIHNPARFTFSKSPLFKDIQIIIEENIKLPNGKLIPDNKFHTKYGTTIILPYEEAVSFISCVADYYITRPAEETDAELPGVLVALDIRGTVQWLEALGIKIPSGVKNVDIEELFMISHGLVDKSLESLLTGLEIPHSHLHNAGNEARSMLEVVKSLCDPEFRKSKKLDFLLADMEYMEKVSTHTKAKESDIKEKVSVVRAYKNWQEALVYVFSK